MIDPLLTYRAYASNTRCWVVCVFEQLKPLRLLAGTVSTECRDDALGTIAEAGPP